MLLLVNWKHNNFQILSRPGVIEILFQKGVKARETKKYF